MISVSSVYSWCFLVVVRRSEAIIYRSHSLPLNMACWSWFILWNNLYWICYYFYLFICLLAKPTPNGSQSDATWPDCLGNTVMEWLIGDIVWITNWCWVLSRLAFLIRSMCQALVFQTVWTQFLPLLTHLLKPLLQCHFSWAPSNGR